MPTCKIEFDVCFPKTLDRASAAFMHVAFENPECGDCSACLISLIIVLSMTTGVLIPISPARLSNHSYPGSGHAKR